MALETLWYTRCPVPTAVGIASQLGILDQAFARKGVKLASIIDSPDPAIRQSHFNHTLPWSFRLGGNVPPLRARSEGRETKLIGISWTDEYQAIIALPESGIKGPADLAGRRLGLPKKAKEAVFVVDFWRATALKGFDAALKLAHIPPAEVRFTDIPFTEGILQSHGADNRFGLPRRSPYGPEIAALHRGEVDAIFVKGAAGIAAANLIGAQEVLSFGFHPDPAIRVNSGTPRLLTADAALVEAHPDLIATLLETLAQAADHAAAHPEETIRFAVQENGTSEEAIRAAHGPNFAASFQVDLRPDYVAAVESYKDFLWHHHLLAADFSVQDWITSPQALAA